MTTKQTSSSATSKATSMADLMRSVKTTFVTLHKGDILKGKITKLASSEILVDINAKTEAVVLEKDRRILRNLLATLRVGDTVDVQVLNPESDLGNPVVSLRRFIDDLVWKKLEDLQKKQQPVEVTVAETTRGGFLVATSEGTSGFLPNSHMIVSVHVSEGEGLDVHGKKLQVYVFELQRSTRKIIFSQKPVVSAAAFEEAVKTFSVGQTVTVAVTNTTPFGLFVSLKANEKTTLDGLIHISEVSWDRVSDMGSEFSSGQQITASIIGFDRNAKRVDLSIKRLSQDPFEEVAKHFAADQKVSGIVSKISSSGVSMQLPHPKDKDNVIEGFIRKEKIPPTIVFAVGDTVNATVAQVDKAKHRIMLVPVLLRKTIGYR